MKLTPVDQIPKMNGYHKLQELIEEFTNGDAKIVKVEFSEVISMDKIKALNTKVMAKDFGRVGLGTLAIVAGAFLWGKFLYGRGVRGCQRWMCETFPDEYESMTEKVADMLEQDH